MYMNELSRWDESFENDSSVVKKHVQCSEIWVHCICVCTYMIVRVGVT